MNVNKSRLKLRNPRYVPYFGTRRLVDIRSELDEIDDHIPIVVNEWCGVRIIYFYSPRLVVVCENGPIGSKRENDLAGIDVIDDLLCQWGRKKCLCLCRYGHLLPFSTPRQE